MIDQEIPCPECGHEFNPSDRLWYLCLNCLTVIGPDEELDDHKPENCIQNLGAYWKSYTEEEAREKQRKRIEEYR